MTKAHEALEKIFHEPSRLAIMSELCGAERGQTFTELKEACGLTDGNLSRHLRVLEQARAVKIRKRFVRNKPRTTVSISEQGREDFLEYLNALERVLQQAASRVRPEAENEFPADAAVKPIG